MSNDPYNPNSTDAMLATIIANQNSQLEKMDGFIEEQKQLRADVDSLKRFKYYLMGAVGVCSVMGRAAWDWLMAGNHK